jgi:phosphatidylserine decarboxylase
MSSNEIKYFNRSTQKIEKELVYGNNAIKFIYDNSFGKLLAPIISAKFVTQLYGSYQDWSISKSKVPPFVDTFSINLDEYKGGSVDSTNKKDSYKSFN